MDYNAYKQDYVITLKHQDYQKDKTVYSFIAGSFEPFLFILYIYSI